MNNATIGPRPPRAFAFLGIANGEAGQVASLAALYLSTSVAFVLAETSAFGLFVEAFGAYSLPFAYISIAVLSSLIGFLFLRLARRVSFRAGLRLNLGFLVLLCLAFYLALQSRFERGAIFLLPFAFQTIANLGNIVVWHLAGHQFNIRQAKRLYSLIVAGGWLGTILGGTLASSFIFLRPTDFYLAAAGFLVLSLGILQAFSSGQSDTTDSVHAPRRGQGAAPGGVRHAFAEPYTRLIFIYTLLWWVSFFIVENIFFHQVEHALTSSGALAEFLGRQRAVVGVVALATTTLVTSRVARRYGLRPGLLIMPALVSAAILLLIVANALNWGVDWLFWTATAARTLNVALGFSISQATGGVLFQPLAGERRGIAQTVAEGIVQPVAMGVAGILLVVFNSILHFDAVGLSWVFLATAVPWFIVIHQVTQRYPLTLSSALKKRTLGESTFIQFDSAAIAQLRQGLKDSRPGPVLYALNQLEQVAPADFRHILDQESPALLVHPAADVRLEALKRVLNLRLASALPVVRARFDAEKNPAVKGMLLRVAATLQDPPLGPRVKDALGSSDRETQAGAILGALGDGRHPLRSYALAELKLLAASKDEADRLRACGILREVQNPEAVGLISSLMDDPVPSVRIAALRAAGHSMDSGLMRKLIAACDAPATARVAESILIQHGGDSLELLARELAAAGSSDPPSRRSISLVRVVGRIEHPHASKVLLPLLSNPSPIWRLEVLQSLSRRGYRVASAGAVLESVRREVEDAAWLSAAIVDIARSAYRAHASVLGHALELEYRDARQRVLLHLSFHYNAAAVLRAGHALDGGSRLHRAMAIETIDALLPAGAKPWLLPVCSDDPHANRVSRWRSAGIEISSRSLEAILRDLLGSESAPSRAPWTRMCAAHLAGESGDTSFEASLRALAGAGHAGMALMGRWALAKLLSPAAHVGGSTMLSIVEKVLVLKSAPLFAETPDNVLAEVADLAEQIDFDGGQTIFNKGDPGDSLYIVVGGSVQVLDEGRLLNELGEGDCFGELALLDPEPRLATVVAVEPTSLLRLDAPHFYEILDSQPEVSVAVIRVITRYLRGQLNYAREANARLQAIDSKGTQSGAEGNSAARSRRD